MVMIYLRKKIEPNMSSLHLRLPNLECVSPAQITEHGQGRVPPRILTRKSSVQQHQQPGHGNATNQFDQSTTKRRSSSPAPTIPKTDSASANSVVSKNEAELGSDKDGSGVVQQHATDGGVVGSRRREPTLVAQDAISTNAGSEEGEYDPPLDAASAGNSALHSGNGQTTAVSGGQAIHVKLREKGGTSIGEVESRHSTSSIQTEKHSSSETRHGGGNIGKEDVEEDAQPSPAVSIENRRIEANYRTGTGSQLTPRGSPATVSVADTKPTQARASKSADMDLPPTKPRESRSELGDRRASIDRRRPSLHAEEDECTQGNINSEDGNPVLRVGDGSLESFGENRSSSSLRARRGTANGDADHLQVSTETGQVECYQADHHQQQQQQKYQQQQEQVAPSYQGETTIIPTPGERQRVEQRVEVVEVREGNDATAAKGHACEGENNRERSTRTSREPQSPPALSRRSGRQVMATNGEKNDALNTVSEPVRTGNAQSCVVRQLF